MADLNDPSAADPLPDRALAGSRRPPECAPVATVAPACELTVLLPCLNESETLATCIRKARDSMERLGIDGEVVIADNGSDDGSPQIAEREGARVVAVRARGYGAALAGGIQAARGRWVLMADADDSYALDDIEPFVAALRGGADLVMGNRFAGGIERGAMPALHRYVGNPVLSKLGRLFFGVPVGDFHCGIRAFDRDKVSALGMRTPGMEFASEMVVRSSLAGLRIEEVPTTLRPDGRSGSPHLRTWRDGWRHLSFLLALTPRWLMLYPALVLFSVGGLGLLALALGPKQVGNVVFSVQTMLACATGVIAGLQLLGLAVVTRSYAARLGLLPPNDRLERMLERVTLDRGVVVGGVLLTLGVVAFVVALLVWGSHGFGALDPMSTMRLPILGMVLVLGGLELIMVSFTVSLSRRSG
ncbi:glycosyltransferase family 2 protein [Nakamurella multipartita]|uniref:glycosyltransferase family 2 protein n=1 Tax=Nakamurella multipartita TaxID=53461 RepID=UPI0010FDDE92|nr:glycosyltransferase family 2 protein [Nakamurella multipartita]